MISTYISNRKTDFLKKNSKSILNYVLQIFPLNICLSVKQFAKPIGLG